ncbi:MAG: YggT family protein [Burkholderiales bacterium]
MLTATLQFMVQTVFSLFLYAALLRFYLQLMGAPFRHPFSQFIMALTDFAVRPLRRVIPGFWGLDMASLLLAGLVQYFMTLTLLFLSGFPLLVAGFHVYLVLALLTVLKLFEASLYILMTSVAVQAILSWVNPHTMLAPILDRFTAPFLRPVRRYIPLVANVDLSPLVVFFICQIILLAPVSGAEQAIRSLF